MHENHSASLSYEEQVTVSASREEPPASDTRRAAVNALMDGVGPVEPAWRPSRVLLTLFGEYWGSQPQALPSAALVALLAEFGISDTAARATLSRMVHHGWLASSRRGRQTFYQLDAQTAQAIQHGARRVFSLGLHTRPWDGLWSFVAFSVPEENRQLRYVLRDRLRWLGFAPLYDGLWISPRDTLVNAAHHLTELAIHTATLFRARIADGTPEAGLPQRAWDLSALHTQYLQFIDEFQSVGLDMQAQVLTPAEAFKARARAIDAWRDFPGLDPDLPDELLPPDWPRSRARQLFLALYNGLGSLAQIHVQQIIARYAPELANSTITHVGDYWL